MDQELLNSKQLSEALGYSHTYVKKLAKAGKIPTEQQIDDGGKRFFRLESVREALKPKQEG